MLRRDVGWTPTTVITALRATSGTRTFALLKSVVSGTTPGTPLGDAAHRAMRYADRYYKDGDCVERCVAIIKEAQQ